MTSIVPPESPASPVSYASWVRQFGAFVIDIIVVAAFPLAVMTVGIVRATNAENNLYASLDQLVGGIALAALLLIVVSTLYFTVLVAKTGQTLGMRIVGITVRDAKDTTRRIGYWRALGRWLLTALLWSFYAVPGVIDLLWPLCNKQRQSLHDKIARSVVVRSGRFPCAA